MKSKKQAKQILVWDWDNTLVNSFDALHQTYLILNQRYRIKKRWTKKDSAVQMNMLTHEALKRFAPLADQKKLLKDFHDCYALFVKSIQAMPGVEKVLQWASENGFLNVLASHKPIDDLNDALVHFGLQAYFHTILGDGILSENKTMPEYAQKVLKLYPNCKCWYVIGDGFVDMQLGVNLGAQNILITSTPPIPQLKKVHIDHKVSKLEEIISILNLK